MSNSKKRAAQEGEEEELIPCATLNPLNLSQQLPITE